MNLHTLIPGTVGLWQLQGTFNDTSGNALDLVSVDGITNLPTTPNSFQALDSCIQGVILNNDPKLMAPLSALLQSTGALTYEWLMQQWKTFTLTYFCVADPAGRTGGDGPDRIGSLYTVWSDSGNPEITDQHIGSNLPSAGYGQFYGSDHTLFGWSDVGNPANPTVTPPGFSVKTHHFAYVRTAAGNWHVLRDGVQVGAGVPTAGANVATGVERFFIGGYEKQSNPGSGGQVMASVRLLNYARSDADILADANATLAPCGGGGGGGGGTANSGGGNTATAASTGLVYDAVAAAQFGMSLRQAPRS